MSVRSGSIAAIMKLTGVVALNLAIPRAAPVSALPFPPFLLMIVLLDLALVQAVAFGRALGIFYFTFLIVGAVASVLITAVAYTGSDPVPGSLHILETAIKHHRAVRGQGGIIPLYIEFPMLMEAERWVTAVLGLSPAWIAAALASRWMRRRRRGELE